MLASAACCLLSAACCLLSVARVDGFDARELRLGDNAAVAAELIVAAAELVFARAVNGANSFCCC